MTRTSPPTTTSNIPVVNWCAPGAAPPAVPKKLPVKKSIPGMTGATLVKKRETEYEWMTARFAYISRPGPPRDDVPDRERECDEREPRDVDGARRQDGDARAAEHPEEGEADDVERCDGDGEGREAGAGARPDVRDGVVEEDEEGPE